MSSLQLHGFTQTDYGPDKQVVNCVAYQHGKALGAITVEDISEFLKRDGVFVWLGLHEPDEEVLRKIKEEFSLHELAIEDAHAAHQRPKLEEYGESLFIVLKTAQLVDDVITFGETHIFVGNASSSPCGMALRSAIPTCGSIVNCGRSGSPRDPDSSFTRSWISWWTTTAR